MVTVKPGSACASRITVVLSSVLLSMLKMPAHPVLHFVSSVDEFAVLFSIEPPILADRFHNLSLKSICLWRYWFICLKPTICRALLSLSM